MGLGIGVGFFGEIDPDYPEDLDDARADLTAINDVLREQGYPPHDEAPVVLELQSRAAIDSFPYSWLHYLRRVTAEVLQDPGYVATPLPEGEDPSDAASVQREYGGTRSHLICHSDAEGYYFPVDFPQVLFDPTDANRIPGAVLGSTQGLMAELVATAPALGITLDGETLSDAEATRLNRLTEDEGPLHIEVTCWLALFEAARLSLAQRAAICFG